MRQSAHVTPLAAGPRCLGLPEPHGQAAVADAWARRHLLATWRFARLLCRSGHLADDLAQEALLAGLGKGMQALPDDAARGWLRQAVRNLWRMHCRTAGRRPRAADIDVADLAWAENGGDDGSAFQAALALCLPTLGDRARLALQLRYGEGAERDAIAAELGLSVDGVKSLLQRAKQLLRGCIERRLRPQGRP